MSPIFPVRLDERQWFPDPASAPAEGLLAVGGDFSPARLLLAYHSGVFPWSVRPITWWSPDPRGIFELDGFHVSRSLARTLRRAPYAITRNRDFPGVIRACATTPGRGTTWITREFMEAYTELHRQGHAHSVECWQGDKLVGGIYGVAVGGLFAGESMFHHATDASKVALHHLVQHLRTQGFVLFDIQMTTPITEQPGAIEISRAEYLRRLQPAVTVQAQFKSSP